MAEILVFDFNRPSLKVSYLNTDFLQEHCPRATVNQEIDLAQPKMSSNYHRAQACRLYSQKPCCLVTQQLGEKSLLALTVCPSVQNNLSSASEPGQSEPEKGQDTVSCLHQGKTQDGRKCLPRPCCAKGTDTLHPCISLELQSIPKHKDCVKGNYLVGETRSK